MTDEGDLRVPDSDDELRQLEQDLYNESRRFTNQTGERVGYARQATQLRAVQRQRADERAPDLSSLGEKFGWSPALMWHLAQPYCYCEIGHDGWEWCRHAIDEGLDGLTRLAGR
ncbi:hypothetical protein GCM10010172_06770 [Paractinoplanes ferrugineus]|uniref:Uncharacterized protein n=1 Tax=Paractinoplanes ferrugineus TaxID=113564 RepID=A0A919J9L8_9ACTN|nr:hypothetical protein [Actinoplanes ferrugineus]GIE16295.1 hypothetical protein Afe05nite_81350 [Actinoplanes ferrugineus]